MSMPVSTIPNGSSLAKGNTLIAQFSSPPYINITHVPWNHASTNMSPFIWMTKITLSQLRRDITPWQDLLTKPSHLWTLQGGSVMTFPSPFQYPLQTVFWTLPLLISQGFHYLLPSSLTTSPSLSFHTSRYHLPTWSFSLPLSRTFDSFMLTVCLRYLVLYLYQLWQAFPRLLLYLTLAMYDN